MLRSQAEQWGEDFSTHGRTLTAAYNRNLEKDYAKYSRRKATLKQKQDALSVAFKELYTNDQLSMRIMGPVHLYAPLHVLLFIKAMSDHRICKQLSFVALLNAHGKSFDYLYYIASLCQYTPSYM